jgi:hypothetical protein
MLLQPHLTLLEVLQSVLYLLDSVGDNFRLFMENVNGVAADSGLIVFNRGYIEQFPRDAGPFQEISDYRDVLLHSPVLAKTIHEGNTYIAKWSGDKNQSPLERSKKSWREAEKMPLGDFVETRELLERLVNETCATLEQS